jgi:hypothetical protein
MDTELKRSISPLPERERMKVRVIIQRAICFARDIRSCFCSFRLRLGQKLVDCLQHFIHIGEHSIVPKSKYAIAARAQKGRADFIFPRSVGMLAAVELNDKAPLDRTEVRKIRSNRMLTSEFYASCAATAQMPPQDSFGVGLLTTQSASVLRR